MTEQASEQANNAETETKNDKPEQQGSETDQPKGGKDAILADLRKERDKRQELERRVQEMADGMSSQRDAVAQMFGVKPDEVSDTEKLSKQFNTLQQQIVASERRALAAEHKVPESLLTGADADAMRAQAVALVEFAQAAHVAAASAAETPAPPAFQTNPGQGKHADGKSAENDDSYPAHWLPPKQQ